MLTREKVFLDSLLEEDKNFLEPYMSPQKFYVDAITLGLELELVLVNSRGVVVPKAYQIVEELRERDPATAYFKWKFFAGQLEINTRVHMGIGSLIDELFTHVDLAQEVAGYHGWHFEAISYLDTPVEFGLKDITPVGYNPWYHDYAAHNWHKVDPMCRVAALHTHVGGRDLQHVVDMHDSMVCATRELQRDPNWISPKRLQAFKTIYPNFLNIPEYEDVQGLLAHAKSIGFKEYLSEYYASVRISRPYATAEFRLDDATLDPKRIESHLNTLASIVS
ncbi:MAG: hypothetical protein Q8O88_00180 [bacterium]|nr:hypothetical protein [bacterium]